MKSILLSVLCLLAFGTSAIAQEKLQKAVDLYRTGDFKGAVTELEAIRATGETARACEIYLGAAYAHLGNETEAREAFRRAWKMSGKIALAGETGFKVTKKKEPDFTRTANARSGTYILRTAVEFLGDGTIGFVFEIEASSSDMFERAKGSARKNKFNPAMADGKPVTVVRFIEYIHYRE
jgi:hypothetical protein